MVCSCRFCRKVLTVQNLLRHTESCVKNPIKNTSSIEKWKKSFYSNKENHKPMGGAHHSEDGLKRLSDGAKKRGLGGHTSKQKLKYKMKNGNFVYLQSSYEIKLAEILDLLELDWTRPEPLMWVDDNGLGHRYYPDFKVGKFFLDTKNDFLALKDARKIKLVNIQNKVDVKIIRKEQITKEFISSLICLNKLH